MVPISLRMKAIADMVPEGLSVADIGCDHGFVAIYLVTQKGSPKAVAMDINEGPLIRAAEHIKQYGLEDVISTRLSDGAVKLEENEVDAAIIAGMGGRLTIKILTDSFDKFRKMKSIILSPHSDIPLVRQYLYSNGFAIDDEDMVFDEGKYYTILRCAPIENGAAALEMVDVAAIEFGPKLIQKKNEVLKEYLNLENTKMREILDKLEASAVSSDEIKKEAINQRASDLKKRIEMIKMTLSQM